MACWQYDRAHRLQQWPNIVPGLVPIGSTARVCWGFSHPNAYRGSSIKYTMISDGLINIHSPIINNNPAVPTLLRVIFLHQTEVDIYIKQWAM